MHGVEVVGQQPAHLGARQVVAYHPDDLGVAHSGDTSTLTCSVDSFASVKITPLTGGTSA